MKKQTIIFSILWLLFAWFSACDKDSSSASLNSNNNGNGGAVPTGRLTIYLTDSPSVVFDSVNIVFSEVSAHIDSDWVTVRGDTLKVNLLDLSNGNTIEFGSADVPAGRYTQVRIKIDNAYVVVDGQQKELTVPSGAQTGLKLGPPFEVTAGSTYELIVDFDVNRSIVIMGPPNNPRYKLKPHLRVMTMALTGSISGHVLNPANLPVAYALQNADTVTSSMVDGATGFFRLSFLPAGVYTVSLEDTLAQSAVRQDVTVEAGSNNDLGEILLQ